MYCLENLENLNAEQQVINCGSIVGFRESSEAPYLFILELDFLKDINSQTPCILEISDGGSCESLDSCFCESLFWQNIETTTSATATFESNDISNFSGTITVELLVEDNTIN